MDLTLKPDVETTFTEIDHSTGDVVTYCMISGEEVSRISKNKEEARFKFSLEISNAIVHLVRGGKTLSEISKVAGMPKLSEIHRWKRVFPNFKENLEIAHQDMVDVFVDDMIIEARELYNDPDPDKIRAYKEKAATTKWVAEKTFTEKYGNKTKIEQEIKGSAGMFVIQTGISREPIEAEVVEVTEIDE